MSIINTALIGKLKKTKADKTNVLELDNTSSFNPSADYHPATKLYVDNAVSGLSPDTNTYVSSGSVSGNTLTLTLNDTSTVDIDVSSLLDDTTNTLSSGVLSGNTITFTREDSTTFDVDVTNLYDDTNLVTSVNGNTGDITVQDTLVSGTNIKTINGISLLGSGDINIQGGSVTGTVYSASLTIPGSPSAGQIWFDQNTGQTFQYHTDADGTQFWMEVGGGAFTDTQYTLKESDVITVTDPNTTTYSFDYYVGFVQVFVNRLKLRKTEFSTVADGSSITLNIDLEVGDEIEIVTLNVVQG